MIRIYLRKIYLLFLTALAIILFSCNQIIDSSVKESDALNLSNDSSDFVLLSDAEMYLY